MVREFDWVFFPAQSRILNLILFSCFEFEYKIYFEKSIPWWNIMLYNVYDEVHYSKLKSTYLASDILVLFWNDCVYTFPIVQD